MPVPHEMVVCPTSPTNSRNGEASVVELKNGNLLMAYGSFYTSGHDDFDAARVMGTVSTDRGRTWGERFVLAENNVKTTFSCSLLRLKSGDILLAYMHVYSEHERHAYARRSSDEGTTWSSEWRINPSKGSYVLNNDRLVQLQSGRIIQPVARVTGEPCDAEDRWHCRSDVFYSDDQGKSWKSCGIELDLPANAGLQEPGVVELRDGRLMMFCRTSKGCQYRSYSRDGGETWTGPEPMSDLVSPVSPAQIKRIPATGHLLAVYNHNYDPTSEGNCGRRCPLTAAISTDEGETWIHRRNIEGVPGKCYAYPSITFIGDEVLLTYNFGGTRADGTEHWNDALKLKMLPLSWFYDEQ